MGAEGCVGECRVRRQRNQQSKGAWKEVGVRGGAVMDVRGLKGSMRQKGSRAEEEQKEMDSC